MKHLLYCGIAFLLMSTIGFAQDWVKMMEDPNVNFYDTQRSFNEYWEGREITKGSGWKPFKRWEHYMEQRVYPHGIIPAPDVVSKNYDAYLSERAPRSIENSWAGFSDWSSLGPDSWQTVSYNPGIGRVNCTAVDPFDSNIMYIGAPAGGFWRSYDGGSTWETTTDELTVLGVTSIAIHPVDTDIIFIATGDGDAGDTQSIGVLKSTDGGDTWQPTGLNWSIYQARRISKILIHPTTPDIILAAASNGVYKSSDGGNSWTLTSSGNFKDMEFKPGDPSVVYVAGTIFRKSTNAGDTFSGASGTPSSGAVNRLALAVTPANPDYVYILAGRNSDSGFYGLYRSTDSGANFNLRSNSPNILGYGLDGGSSGGQSWYDLAIAASPTDPEQIYCGGVNIWESSNGGTSWDLNAFWFYFEPSVPYVHADIHSLEFHGNRLFAGADGGCWITDDGGTNWTDISAGLVTTQFYRIGGYPGDEGLLVGGTQDNGSNRLKNGQWTHVFGADGMEAAIDYSDPNIMYVCYQGGGLLRSFDGGENFSDARGNINEGGQWITPYVIDPVNPSVLYAGYGSVWKSENRGDSWQRISSSFGGINALVVAPSDPNYIYASSGSSIWVTKDGGTNWQQINNGAFGQSITYITVSDANPEHVWVSLSSFSDGNKVYKSTDAGANWQNYSDGLPNLPANCILSQNNSADAVYVGMDVGVYYRNNSMSEWEPYFTNMPNVIVRELEIHYASGKIRAATYGRGIWESPIVPGSAAIDHTPLVDTENLGPYPILVQITRGAAPLVPDSLQIIYGTDGSFTGSALLAGTGNPDEYSGEIPSLGSGVQINYYLSVSDTFNISAKLPSLAPTEYFSFYAGPDTVAPLLTHRPFFIVHPDELPLTVSAEASDNLGVENVTVAYSINGAAQPDILLTETMPGHYNGNFPFDMSTIALDDEVEYQVIAKDVAASVNTTVSGPHVFTIRELNAFSQTTNVTIPDNDATGIRDTLTISDGSSLQIADLKVVFKATHTNFGDLGATLTSPQGTQITLMDRPGFPAVAFFGCIGNDPDIILDDHAEISVEDLTTFANNEQVIGAFRPDPDAFVAFRGEDYQGDWVLQVTDTKPIITGTLTEWGLLISTGVVTGIDDPASDLLPKAFALHQNYPNPFNPITSIRYDLQENADVKLTIYNLLGQVVNVLVNESQRGGKYTVQWQGKNALGQPISSGVYFYRLDAGRFSQTRKMLFMK